MAVKYDTEFVNRPPHPSMSATYMCVLVATKYGWAAVSVVGCGQKKIWKIREINGS